PARNALPRAASCRPSATGGAEVLDPIDLYRRALESANTRSERAGRDWRLTLRGNERITQVVVVDGRTYLPKRIEWQDRGRTVATIRIVTLERAQVSADAFRLQPHPAARIRHLTATGKPVRVVSETPIEIPRDALWLGPDYLGSPARAVRVRFTGGTAVRIA